MNEENSFLDMRKLHQQRSLRIRVRNGKTDPAYVTLLDPDFRKEGVLIDTGIMDDPSPQPNGHPLKYTDLIKSLQGKVHVIDLLYLWSPNLAANLDLYTMHVYEAVPGAESFSDLRIIKPLLDPYQVRSDVCWVERVWYLRETTRISLYVPAMSSTLIDLYIFGAEKPTLEMPI